MDPHRASGSHDNEEDGARSHEGSHPPQAEPDEAFQDARDAEPSSAAGSPGLSHEAADEAGGVQESEDEWEECGSSAEEETASQDAPEAASRDELPPLEGPAAPPGQRTRQEDEADAVRVRGLGKHGCEHYRRRCQLVAPCCGQTFWCRHCHNAEKNEREQVK